MVKSKILVLAPLLLAIHGCGGGGGSSSTTESASKGLFLDAEVEGLTYTTTSGLTGTTDENGTYQYIPGEQISFSVGGVNIGTVDGAPKCTPFDFAAASTNIARFLQSLDADGDPTNGIDIVEANTALAGTTVSSDAFTGDDATFAANLDIIGALAAAGGATLIDPVVALANLNTGTDDTFDNTDLEDKLFVVIDPIESDIGIISFDTIASGAEVFSIFAGDTTAAGSDGQGTDETWSVDAGVLTLTDTSDGRVTTVKRIGGSTRSISVTHSEGGVAPLPASLLIPRAFTAAGLGGGGVGGDGITSKTYDVIDSDGSPINVTFSSNGTFTDNTNNESATFAEDSTPNVIVINHTATEMTFLIVIGGDPTVVDENVDILILGAEFVGDPADDLLSFTDIGVGSVTLKSVTAAP
jgi:hypothetical protein